jgi:hypothetical protein
VGEGRAIRNELAAELSRRQLLARAGTLGLGAMILGAAGVAEQMTRPGIALAQDPLLTDPTLQAFFDTVIPGRLATKTDLGNDIHPKAIAGVDSEPGAVETDALALAQDPRLGFQLLEAPFLAELEAFALLQGGDFLDLSYEKRQAACVQGFKFGNPTRVVWEAAAAVAFTSFCAAATQVRPTSRTASGWRVMGFPGAAPHGHKGFSYRRRLSRERTEKGYLP